MGMTITEKILARAAGVATAKPGDILDVRVDLVYTMDFLGRVIFGHLDRLGSRTVFDPERCVLIFDHQAPAYTQAFADIHAELRKSAQRLGVKLYDVGRHGIMHQLVVEEALLLPGDVALGTDSHTPTAGAMGALVVGVGALEAAIAMATGRIWLRVPESVKVEVTGEFPPGTTSRDLGFHLMGLKGWDGGRAEWAYRAIEFTGSTVERMDVASRLALTNLVSDMGAKNGIMEPNGATLEFVQRAQERSGRRRPFEVVQSDPDANYVEHLTVDVSRLEPQVACPDTPDNVRPLSDVVKIPIDQAVIGSCTNARLEDLHMAARVLKGRKVHPRVRLIVSPASTRIFNEALRDGTLATLAEAGAVIGPSTCAPCWGGGLSLLSKGETCISTTPRNMPGRMGSAEARIYLANPAVVAASAIEGVIADPRPYLNAEDRGA